MNYKVLWEERKRAYAQKVDNAPNPNAAMSDAKELAAMVLMESDCEGCRCKFNSEEELVESGKMLTESPFRAEYVEGMALSPLHEQSIEKKMEDLKEASKPLIDYLYKYDDPYTSVIVTMDLIRVTQDTIGIPFEI